MRKGEGVKLGLATREHNEMEALDALLQVSTLAGTQHAHLLVVATITKKCNVLQTKSFLS